MHGRSGNHLDKYGNPFYSWLSVFVFGLLASGIVGAMLTSWRWGPSFEEDLRKWKSWPAATGHASGVRVVEEPLSEAVAKVRVIRAYRGECLVEYSVGAATYSVWSTVDSDSDRESLERRMRTCPFPLYEVHYNPQEPSIAHAFIAGSKLP